VIEFFRDGIILRRYDVGEDHSKAMGGRVGDIFIGPIPEDPFFDRPDAFYIIHIIQERLACAALTEAALRDERMAHDRARKAYAGLQVALSDLRNEEGEMASRAISLANENDSLKAEIASLRDSAHTGHMPDGYV